MVETDVRGYLYEPQYSDEQLRAMEEQEAAEAAVATAEADDLPAADEEPTMARAGADWWCLCYHCAPMATEQESVRCREFQRCQFLQDEITESEDDTDVCCRSPEFHTPGFTPHLNSWVLDKHFRTQIVYWKRQPKLAVRNRRLSIE